MGARRTAQRLLILAALFISIACTLCVGQTALQQQPPTPSSASVNGASLTITFSESFTSDSSVDKSDFTVKLGTKSQTVSSATASGATVTLTLSAAVPDSDCTSDSVTVDYSGAKSTLSATGGTVAAFTGQAVTNSTDAAPQIVSISTDVTGQNVYVEFCEPIATLVNWTDFSSFTVAVGSDTRDVNDARRSWTDTSTLQIIFGKTQKIEEGETVTLAYDQSKGKEDSPLQDADQGSKLVASWSARSVTNNVDDPPTLSSVSALYDVVTLTFSEALDEDNVPAGDAFSIGGINDPPTVSSVAVSGSTVTLTLSSILHNRNSPTYSLTYVKPTQSPLSQKDGNHKVADDYPYLFQSSTPDTKPKLTKAEVSGKTLALTFDLPLKNVAPASAFTVEGVSGLTVSSSSYKGAVVTLTLSKSASADDTLTVTYEQPDDPPRVEARNNRDADSFEDEAVTNKTVAPSPTLSSAVIAASGASLTLTFSIALDTSSSGIPATSTFALTGTSAAVTAVAVSGSTATLTLSPAADVNETIKVSYTPPSVSTAARLRSSGHNKAVAQITTKAVTNNTDGKPRPVSASIAGASLGITFDRDLDASSLPAASAFTLRGVTASISAVSISGKSLTLTVNPAVDHTQSVTIAYSKPDASPITRASSTLEADSFGAITVTNSTADPTPTFSSATVSATGAALTITMSSALLETSSGVPAASRFTIGGTTSAKVSSVAVKGSTVTLTLNPIADLGDTVTVSYTTPSDQTSARLRSSNAKWAVAAWSGESVTDNADGVPRPTSATVNGTSLVVTFDRDLDSSEVPSTSSFAIGGITATVSNVSINGKSLTLSITPAADHTQSVTVSYTKPSSSALTRANSTLEAASFSALSTTNSTANPTPTFSSAAVASNGATLTVTMSDALLETSDGVPAASLFTLGGSTTAKVSNVAVKDSTVTLTLTPLADVGETLTVSYAPPADKTSARLTSANGKWAVAAWSAESATNNSDGKPRLQSAAVNGDTLTLTFDRPLDSSKVPLGSNFGVTPSTTSVSLVGISKAVVTLTLSSAVSHDDTVTVSYTATGTWMLTRDESDLLVDSFTSASVTNNTTEPLLIAASGNGASISITFSKALDATSVPAGNAFSLGAKQPAVTSVSISGSTITLALVSSLREGAAYTIAYSVPSTHPIQLSDDTDVAAFTVDVTNNTDVAPAALSVVGDSGTITLSFDQALDSDSSVTTDDFTVSAASTATVSSLERDGSTITLTLSRNLLEDEAATLAYVQPSAGGIADPGGKRTPSFSLPVRNDTDTAPVPVSGVVDGATVTIVLDQDLYADPRFDDDDGYPVEHFSLTGTDASITFVEVSNDGSGGVGQIVITLDEDVGEGDAITIRYYPTFGTIRIRDDDAGENRASIDSYALTNLTDVPPAVVSAVVDGKVLTVTFTQALDAKSLPAASSFALSNSGPAVDTVAVSGATLTLSLKTSVIEGAAYSLQYTVSSSNPLQDATANTVSAFTKKVTNDTDYAPTPVRVTTNKRGTTVYLLFDQALDSAGAIDASWFSLGKHLSIDSLVIDPDVSGNVQLKLKLASSTAIAEGAALALAYTQPSTGGLEDDDAGNRVASFSFTVTNLVDVAPRVVGAIVAGPTLVVAFDQALDSAFVPPADCDGLSTPADRTACKEDGTITWFEVVDSANEKLAVASVAVSPDKVTLTLVEPVGRNDAISVSYSRQSLDGGRWNLRDTSSPGNEVLRFSPMAVRNLTAAAPTVGTLGRTQADLLRVGFDGELSGTVDASQFVAIVNGSSAQLASASVNGSSLMIQLASPVPECATVVVRYSDVSRPLLDIDGRPIRDFRVAVPNLLDSNTGLRCVQADRGGLVLTFDSVDGVDHSAFTWRLLANGIERVVTADSHKNETRLLATPSICVGGSIALYYDDGTSEKLLIERTLAQAAPCIVAAVSRDRTLTLTFDQPLKADTLPDLSAVSLSDEYVIESVTGVSGNTLTLQVRGPGIHLKSTVQFSYAGGTLAGSGGEVGPFAVDVTVEAVAPALTSAIAIDSLIILQFNRPLVGRQVAAARFLVLDSQIEENIVDSVYVQGSSVTLMLNEDLPDDPDIFALVYLAKQSAGLESLLGARVSDSVFLVRNLTETPPHVVSVLANRATVTVTFDQRVKVIDADTTDFTVIAGRRSIAVESMTWSESAVVLTLDSVVTSRDAVLLTYAPTVPGSVRDSSGLPLAAFQLEAINGTAAPQSVEARVAEARLRAGDDPTTFARELARGFASQSDGIRTRPASGDGWTTVTRGGATLRIDASTLGDEPTRVSAAPLLDVTEVLALLESVPPTCNDIAQGAQITGWWIGRSDLRGVPLDSGFSFRISGAFDDGHGERICALDLLSGEWSVVGPDSVLTAPALLIQAPTTLTQFLAG